MPQPHQRCPICQKPVHPSERYPRYLCEQCTKRAKSINGRPLKFFNESFSGGFIAQYADTSESYPSHECYIDGIPCHADEHYFGGIVIQPI
jgi:predicted amidophosphoribosyltransferase